MMWLESELKYFFENNYTTDVLEDSIFDALLVLVNHILQQVFCNKLIFPTAGCCQAQFLVQAAILYCDACQRNDLLHLLL
jgi:hypothetical protein